jgi:hypothetical protein
MHQSFQGATFHVEHVLPRAKGGPSDLDNLAWSCPTCNLHKSDRTEVIGPENATAVPLFNPRRDAWTEHFEWEGYRVVGKTPVCRASVLALDLNHPRRLLIRRAEQLFALFPPDR